MREKMFLFFILVIFGLCAAKVSYAASFSFDPEFIQLGVGDEGIVHVLFDPQGESINAIEGVIKIPNTDMEVVKIFEGNSFINAWIDGPRILESGSIAFAGIAPNGYTGKEGNVLSFIVRSRQSSEGTVMAGQVRAFRNDGKASLVDTSSSKMSYVFFGKGGKKLDVEKDLEPPETFEILVTKDESMFDGKYFVVFMTEDKISGIDHYEIKEGIFGLFQKVESPYVLMNQELTDSIEVKAVDHEGNERIVKIPPPNPRPWYTDYVTLSFLAVCLLVLSIRIFIVAKKITHHEL